MDNIVIFESEDKSVVAKFATVANNEKEMMISVIMNCIDRKG